jgi:2-hydroxychromene-2-carboxylate isomerase
MTLSVDLFFSFRSPYSYLALPKTLELAADYDVTVNLRPVYPLAGHPMIIGIRMHGSVETQTEDFRREEFLDIGDAVAGPQPARAFS